MGFPLSVDGSFTLAPVSQVTDPAHVLIMATNRIKDEGAVSVHSDGESLAFLVPFFRMRYNWNILTPYDRGHLELAVRDNTLVVSYVLSTKRLVIIGSIFALAAGLVGAEVGRPENLWMAPVLALVAWVWFVGANYLIAASRIGGWLTNVMRQSLRNAA